MSNDQMFSLRGVSEPSSIVGCSFLDFRAANKAAAHNYNSGGSSRAIR